MAFFPILTMPRVLFDMDNWFDTTLDIFDPFDELDQEICKNLQWLRRPVFRMEEVHVAKVPSKYRLNIDVRGYKADSIDTEVKENKLIVNASDIERLGGVGGEEGDFVKKEFRKTFKLPLNVDESKMISFITRKGNMIVEIPYKDKKREQFKPKITKLDNGTEQIQFDIDVSNIDLSKILVTLKDYDVLVSTEETMPSTAATTTVQHPSRAQVIRKFKLPHNTNLTTLRGTIESPNMLCLQAKLIHESEKIKKIPIVIPEQGQEGGVESKEQPKAELREEVPKEREELQPGQTTGSELKAGEQQGYTGEREKVESGIGEEEARLRMGSEIAGVGEQAQSGGLSAEDTGAKDVNVGGNLSIPSEIDISSSGSTSPGIGQQQEQEQVQQEQSESVILNPRQ